MQAAPAPGPRAPGVPRLRLVRHRAPRGRRARVRPRRRAARESEVPRRLERLGRDDGARPHALGDARRRHGGECPPARRLRCGEASRSCSTGSSRTTASSSRASPPTVTRSPPRPTPRPSPTSSSATTRVTLSRPCALAFAELEGHFAFVVIHHDHPGLLVGARQQACRSSSGIGSRTRCSSPRTRRPSCARRVPCSSRATARSSRITPDGATFQSADGTPGRARADRARLGRRGCGEGAASRRSCSRRSTSSPKPSPRRSATAFATGRSSSRGSTCRARTSRSSAASSSSASGTAYHACVVGRYVIEEWARVPVEFDIASEWIYRNPVINEHDLVIGITQSGETRDTIEALKLARENGARTVAITNMMGSQVTREVDSVLYTRAGLEMARRVVEDVHGAGRAPLPRRAEARADPRDASARRDRVHPRLRLQAAEQDPAVPRRRPPDRGDRAALPRRALLPLPRPPHRPSGRARGRAQAEGDLVHPDRGVLGGRDEARADRAPRRGRRRSSSSRRTSTSTTRSSRTSRRFVPAARTSSRSRPTATRTSSITPTTSSTSRRRRRSSRSSLAILPLQLLAYRIARLRGLNVDQPRNLAKTVTVE